MIKKVAALSLVISLTSCVGLSSRDIFTDLRNNPAGASQNTVENCEKTDMEVSLYFESEPINFEYEKIGLIEVQGSDYHNDLDVINKLKALSKVNAVMQSSE